MSVTNAGYRLSQVSTNTRGRLACSAFASLDGRPESGLLTRVPVLDILPGCSRQQLCCCTGHQQQYFFIPDTTTVLLLTNINNCTFVPDINYCTFCNGHETTVRTSENYFCNGHRQLYFFYNERRLFLFFFSFLFFVLFFVFCFGFLFVVCFAFWFAFWFVVCLLLLSRVLFLLFVCHSLLDRVTGH